MMTGGARLDDRVDRGAGKNRVSELSLEEDVLRMLAGSRLAPEGGSQNRSPRGGYSRDHWMPAAVFGRGPPRFGDGTFHAFAVELRVQERHIVASDGLPQDMPPFSG